MDQILAVPASKVQQKIKRKKPAKSGLNPANPTLPAILHRLRNRLERYVLVGPLHTLASEFLIGDSLSQELRNG
jgi:hypothetical protein